MHFENEFVAHCKIHFFNFAPIKSYSPKSHVINFGFAKNTIVKNTINKSHSQKGAGRKVTVIKNTAFKIFKINIVFTVNNGIVLFIKEIFRCFFQDSITIFVTEKIVIKLLFFGF